MLDNGGHDLEKRFAQSEGSAFGNMPILRFKSTGLAGGASTPAKATKDCLRRKRRTSPISGNRKISRRIKRPPSQCAGIEMAAGIFIMVLEFCIPGARSPGGKIPPRIHPPGSAPVRYSGAKPGSGRDPGHSLLRFQSDCRSQRWTGRRRGCWKRASSSGP